MKNERFKITPAVYLILVKDNRILLSRRLNTGFCDGAYSLVAGHFDGGETMIQAAIREAREEAGIELMADKLRLVHVQHRYVVFNDVGARERIDFFLQAEEWEGEPVNTEPHKCDDLSWFDLDKLPENIIPYVRKAVEYAKNNIIYSEDGFENKK